MEGTSGAVLDHQEAERERQEAERIAEDEALAAAGVDEPAEPGEVGVDGGQPDDPEPEAAEPTGEVVLEGVDGQLSFSVGGKKPTGASIRVTGGKISLPGGEFKKGERLILRVPVIVTEVAFVDELDPKTKQVVGCERRHKARVSESVGLLNE